MHQPAAACDADDLTLRSAVEIAAGVRDGAFSAAEVLEAFLARHAAINPRLNAVVTPLYEAARSAARAVDDARRRGDPLGPLAGVPMTLKDCFDLTGVPSTLGIGPRRLLTADADGPVVQRLRRAGAVLVGKTNVPQIMLMFETDNRLFGRTPHPERDDRGSGGSSGGEAAAVAARLSALGLGSDLLGSIRQPAHACGVHGFKPSMHRIPNLGVSGAIRGMDAVSTQPGPLARRMCDVVALARLLLEDPYDDVYAQRLPWIDPATVEVNRLRVGVWDDCEVFRPAPAVRRAVREAAEALRSLGAEVVPFALPEPATALRLCLQSLASGAAPAVRRELRGERPIPSVALSLQAWEAPPWLRKIICAGYELRGQGRRAELIRWSHPRSASEYWDLVLEVRSYVRLLAETWRAARLDAVLAPPHGLPALLRGTASETLPAGVYAFTFNLLGAATGTVAATRVRADEETVRPESRERIERFARRVELGSTGLPIGVQVSALPGRDEICLAVMQALETHFAAQPDFPPRSVPAG